MATRATLNREQMLDSKTNCVIIYHHTILCSIGLLFLIQSGISQHLDITFRLCERHKRVDCNDTCVVAAAITNSVIGF